MITCPRISLLPDASLESKDERHGLANSDGQSADREFVSLALADTQLSMK